jgi:catechol 2,3-dioxygenase-like lactoylglutathione lyase family enzyme
VWRRIFLVADVTTAAEFYRDKLGFMIRGYCFEDAPVFAMVGRDDDQRICGMKELEVRDLDGYVLCFGQDVPPAGGG